MPELPPVTSAFCPTSGRHGASLEFAGFIFALLSWLYAANMPPLNGRLSRSLRPRQGTRFLWQLRYRSGRARRAADGLGFPAGDRPGDDQHPRDPVRIDWRDPPHRTPGIAP